MPKPYSPSRTLSLHWPAQMPEGLPSKGLSSFASGRQAIYALVQHLGAGKEVGRVLLPAWVAEGVYLPFVRAEWQIVFYELDHQANPDWQRLEQLLAEHQFDLVILIHYFGQQRDVEKLIELIAGQCPILEDWAHSYPCAVWPPPVTGNWALFSPTKLVGTTDGAWLVGPEKLADYYQEQGLAKKRIAYVCWQLLYLLGSTFVRLKLPIRAIWNRLSGGSYARGYQLQVELTDKPSPISAIGTWLIKHTAHKAIETNRTAQAARYSKHLRNPHIHLLGSDKDNEQLPWVGFPLRVDEPQKFAAYLAQHNIRGQRFTEKWWFYSDTSHYPIARKLWEQHFLLPIHQDFSLEDIDYIIKVVNAYQ